MRGGTETSRSLASEPEPVVDALDLSNGEAGRRVVENGEGAVGGGRWMNVKPSGRFEISAFGLFRSGSIIFGGGLTALLVA